jgi:hypothetical protein
MTTALKQFDKIDAFTVTMTQLRMGCTWRRKMPVGKKTSSFSAIDALPNEGVTWVCKGELSATFLYATPGAEGAPGVKDCQRRKGRKEDHPSNDGGRQDELRTERAHCNNQDEHDQGIDHRSGRAQRIDRKHEKQSARCPKRATQEYDQCDSVKNVSAAIRRKPVRSR